MGVLKRFFSAILEVLDRIRKLLGHNIATIIFSVILLYMILSTIFYVNSTHIESYQVISGPLSSNEIYTGLALHEEMVVKADSGGYVDYYAREGNKINANGAVYGLSQTQNPEVETKLSQEALSSIRRQMLGFSRGFSTSKFNQVYSFKYQLEGSILQYSGVTGQSVETPTALTYEEMEAASREGTPFNATANAVTFGNQTICKAETDGIVLYSMDGYAGKTVDNVTADDFNQNHYQVTNLKTKDKVRSGDEIYTLITDERWSLLIPLSEKQAVRLANRTSVRVKFLKDDMTQLGDFSVVTIEGNKYGKIDFNKGLIRYASDRFLDIELVTNTLTGLKIPLSSIVTKDFYTIPSTFATTDSSTGLTSFMVSEKDEKGNVQTRLVTPTIYAGIQVQPQTTLGAEEGASSQVTYTYYVDQNAFTDGELLITNDGQNRYIIGETSALEGVYCINQGYAVFRRIEILDQNEEYAIISRNTAYGLSRYDNIVRNADRVKEEDILY